MIRDVVFRRVMENEMHDIVEELRGVLPPVFAGPKIGELTGGVIHWPTVQNKRSRREIPDECFAYSGRRVIVRRDPFLSWWASTLSSTFQGKVA